MIATKARGRPRGGLADKRRAILAGALTMFARDGYTRASIEAIAGQAGVSTRTIYNHFHDKAELFEVLIQESATQVAEAQIAVIDTYLRKVTDLEADLVEFGVAWAGSTKEFAEHFALVRQINAETGHIPPHAIRAWQATGPLRVRRALAKRLGELADHGLLTIDDADRAALHLSLLISTTNPSYHGDKRTTRQVLEMVTTGVRAFLHGYGH